MTAVGYCHSPHSGLGGATSGTATMVPIIARIGADCNILEKAKGTGTGTGAEVKPKSL